MRTLALSLACLAIALTADLSAQRRTTRKPPAMKTEPAKVQCRESLGAGVRTKASYCFVLAGRDPAEGVVITIPSHSGPATLLFDLHNRHTYSEAETKANRGYRKYTATIGVLTMDNTLVDRAVIQSEFRTEQDLFDRIGGGAGPGGVDNFSSPGRPIATISNVMLEFRPGPPPRKTPAKKTTTTRP